MLKKSNKRTLVVGDAAVMGTGGSTTAEDVYYIPFVRDAQNYVNAAMVIKTSATDTTLSYKCDWQYKQKQNDVNSLNDAAENFAVFFMVLDNNVFGHTKFKIIDKNIFKFNNNINCEVTLTTKQLNNSGTQPFLLLVTRCQDITISYLPKICSYMADPTRGYCNDSYNPTVCDKCPRCWESYRTTVCWDEWEDGGDEGGGDEGGGGGGGWAPVDDPQNQQDPCTTVQNKAKALDTLYANAGIDTALAIIGNLSTLTVEKGFPVFQNFIINPSNSADTSFTNTACSSTIYTGTATGIQYTFSYNPNTKMPIAAVHTHPPGGYTAQSANDIYILIEDADNYSHYRGNFVAASNGSKYAIAITDKTLATAFLNTKAANLNDTTKGWKEDSDIGKGYSDAYKHFLNQFKNDTNKENLSYEMAMAAVLNQFTAGITLYKQDANGNFKPIVVQTNVTTTGRGIFKKTVTTYTQTCN